MVHNLLIKYRAFYGPEIISDIYKNIIGKEISVKIVLSEANVSGDSNIYKAVDIVDPSVHQPCVADTTPESSSHVFTHSGALDGIELFQTPGSSTSVSKKIKQEKEVVDII
ncbi:hypothetical protein ACET3Z_030091 [Daucus carota]